MPQRIALCILSEAAGGVYMDRRGMPVAECELQDCPLDLTPAEARRCPCKTRRDVGEVQNDRGRYVDVQVLACCYPQTWNGTQIRNPAAFARSLRRKS